MNKKKWIIFLALALLIGLAAGIHRLLPTRLFVNGQRIREDDHACIRYSQDDAEIPVLTIFRALGMDADIRYNEAEDTYEVVTADGLVVCSTADDDADRHHIRRVVGDEFIVDSGSMYWVFYINHEIDIDVNVRRKTVHVTAFTTGAYVETPARLIVNGKNLSSAVSITKREYYEQTIYVIPVLAVLRQLGVETSWEGDTAVTISRPGKSYTFDLTDNSFGYDGPPGGIGVRFIQDQELYMEDISVRYFLEEFMDAELRWNHATNTVHIKSK